LLIRRHDDAAKAILLIVIYFAIHVAAAYVTLRHADAAKAASNIATLLRYYFFAISLIFTLRCFIAALLCFRQRRFFAAAFLLFFIADVFAMPTMMPFSTARFQPLFMLYAVVTHRY